MLLELVFYHETWNKSLVCQAFDKEEADVVVQIPLAPTKRSDVMYGPHRRYDQYWI